MTSNQSLIKKADMAIGDLATAGLLTPEQTDKFIRVLIDQPTIMNSARIVTMNSPQRNINKIGFGSRILRRAVSATRLAANDRVSPDLSQIKLITKEVIAELLIPYDVFEDNIEGGNISAPMGSSAGGLQDTIVAMIAQRAAIDLEELLILGDTNSGDNYLNLLDGYLKLATAHIVSAGGNTFSKDVCKAGAKALPPKYLRNKSKLVHYVSTDNEIEFRDTYANRQTALGDTIMQGQGPVYAFGSEVIGASLMPNASGLFTDPQNLIVGIQRKVSIEYDKDIGARVFQIVLTCRLDATIEETDAVVTYSNIG